MEEKQGKALRCSCGLPFGFLEGRELVVKSRHQGETHVNAIRLDVLAQMAGGSIVWPQSQRREPTG